MTTQLAVSVETDGKHCGRCSKLQVQPRGEPRCGQFNERLEQTERPLGTTRPQEPPLRCEACRAAERQYADDMKRSRVQALLQRSDKGGAPSLAHRR